MSDLAELRWRTREMVGIADTELDTSPDDIDRYLNEAYRAWLSAFSWTFLRQLSDVVTTAGTADYTLAVSGSTVRQVRRVTSTVDGIRRPLRPRPDRVFDRGDVETGVPCEYALDGPTAIRVFPTPDGEYDLAVEVLVAPASLSADDDVPTFDEEFHDGLAYAAAARLLHRRRADGDVGRADDMAAQAAGYLERLRRHDLGDHDPSPSQHGGRWHTNRTPKLGWLR